MLRDILDRPQDESKFSKVSFSRIQTLTQAQPSNIQLLFKFYSINEPSSVLKLFGHDHWLEISYIMQSSNSLCLELLL
jgi:hypothetical protein